MINAFYTAKSGASSFQSSLDVTANNIANANTQGYKAQSAVFSELVGTDDSGALVGSGSRMSAVNRDLSQGAPNQTGGWMDAAIVGEGFFAVMDADGAVYYTRCGSFTLSNENGENYLVTHSGEYVLDADNSKIKVERGFEADSLYKAALYAFDNPEALTLDGGGRYIANARSGAARPDGNSTLLIGAQERSNVDLLTEMTNMMTAQRNLQYNIKMVQTAEEIEQTVNNLRG